MSVLGQTVIKLGVSGPAREDLFFTRPVSLILFIAQNPKVLLGLLFYGLGSLAWIVVLSRLELSYAYPFVAINFILIAFISRLVFSETISGLRWLGIASICIGILLVAYSAGGK